MIKDDGKNFIICSGYGSFEVYPCTLENAKTLLRQNEPERRLDAAVVALSKRTDTDVHRSTPELLTRALQDVMECEVGEPSEALTRLVRGRQKVAAGEEPAPAEPELLVTQALKDEVTLWCVRRHINPLAPGDLRARALNDDPDLRSLSVLSGLFERAGERKLQFVEREELDQADEYWQLTEGRWKAEAKESRVVQRYLSFINDYLCGRDTRYHLAELRTPT